MGVTIRGSCLAEVRRRGGHSCSLKRGELIKESVMEDLHQNNASSALTGDVA